MGITVRARLRTGQKLDSWGNFGIRPSFASIAFLALGVAVRTLADPAPVQPAPVVPQAPPPAISETRAEPPPGSGGRPAPAAPTALYSIGQPSDEEQLYLELLNRTRANPAAEATRLASTDLAAITSAYDFFDVDLVLMQAAISVIPAAQPLAFHEKLITAARGHSQWMFANEKQSHFQGAVTPAQRVTAAGYTWQTTAENIFAFATDAEQGHAGFEVDWGDCALCLGGMQTPPGHRNNNHNPDFREIGIGVLNASTAKVGPQLVTFDFGSQFSPQPLITGVAFYDLNGNGFYDLGEGVGGLQVDVTGAADYAVTAESGGYTVPTLNGPRTVTFTGPSLPTVARNVTVSGDENAKVDLAMTYQPPVVSGPVTVNAGSENAYSFSGVGGATGYEWRIVERTPLVAVEGAEQGLGGVTLDVSPGYSVIATDLKYTGTGSFHLPLPEGEPQSLLLKAHLRPSATAALKFWVLLGWASTAQTAHAQVSTDDGHSWIDLFTRQGTDSAGDQNFSQQSISLAPYAGKEIQIRFLHKVAPGIPYYPQTARGVGLYLDDISFTNTELLTDVDTGDVAAGNPVNFHPVATGDYGITVRPKVSQRVFPYGAFLPVNVKASTPSVIHLAPPTIGPNGKVRINFQVVSGSPSSFTLQRTTNPPGGWETVQGITLSNDGGGAYSYRGDVQFDQGFYRVRAQ